MIWSIACMAKLKVMNSTIGFRPAMAAPTPTPAKPCSVIGVSMTRLRTELLQQALGDLVGALVLGDFLAHDEHVAVAAHFLGHGVAQRLAHRCRHHFGAGRNVGIGLRLGSDGCGGKRARGLRVAACFSAPSPLIAGA